MIKKIFRNDYLFSLMTKVLSVGVGFLYSIVYSRFLGAELRGTASIITNYSEIISIILTFGAFNAYPYFVKKEKKDLYEGFVNNIFALFFLYLAIACVFAYILKSQINLIVAILIAPFWMCSRQLNYVVLIENPKLSNIANAAIDVFDLVFVTILLFVLKANLTWCIAIVSAKHVVLFCICIININKRKYKFKPSLTGIMPYIRYGIIPMITIILMEINYKMDILMLEWFGITTAEIGVYSLGVMLAQKVLLIPDALKDILLSKLVAGKNRDEVCRICRISFTVTLLCEFLIIIFGKMLINLLYGAEYSNAYITTVIICAGVLGMVFYKMIYSYNIVNGHKNTNLFILGASGILNVFVNALLIPSLKSNGAAVASLISYLFCGIGFVIFFCHKEKISVKELIFINKQDIKGLKSLVHKS